jgi:8-oxo-dGTP pyrophosphatase MutT (NUDIX family)
MSQEPENRFLWRVLRRETIYRSDWITLHQDWVELPDGTIIDGHHVVEYPRPAVSVVPINAAGQVMMIDHYRFITQERSWELVGGGVDDGEDLEAAARREMLEESGCTGGEFTYMGRFRPSIGSTNQLFHLFLARGVAQTAPIADTNEVIAARWFNVAEVRELIDQNRIVDGFSLTALLMAFYKGYL